MLIYKITNIKEDKSYVGLTTKSMKERIRSHIENYKGKDKKNYLYRAMRKYGIHNFVFEELDTGASIEELRQKEIAYIKAENTLWPNGYNLTKGGEHIYITHNPQQKPVKAIYKYTGEVFYYKSVSETKKSGFSAPNVSQAANKITKYARDFIFDFISKEEYESSPKNILDKILPKHTNPAGNLK